MKTVPADVLLIRINYKSGNFVKIAVHSFKMTQEGAKYFNVSVDTIDYLRNSIDKNIVVPVDIGVAHIEAWFIETILKVDVAEEMGKQIAEFKKANNIP
jgi:hypothetical protein